MKLALSSRWNAFMHASGEAMIREIRDLGFDAVELGFDLRQELAADVRSGLAAAGVMVTSVHAFCPVPPGVPRGHPELYSLADTDSRARENAVRHMEDTVRFAAMVGAGTVVAHAGRVDIGDITSELISLAESGRQDSSRFDKLKVKLILRREKKAAAHIEALSSSIEALLPALDGSGVNLALENLPYLESVPSETEMEALLARFSSPRFGYWHDTGHSVVRQRLGFAGQLHTLRRVGPRLLGMHAHSVAGFAIDHLMPPRGELDIDSLAGFIRKEMPVVLEPAPGTPANEVKAAASILRRRWDTEKGGQ